MQGCRRVSPTHSGGTSLWFVRQLRVRHRRQRTGSCRKFDERGHHLAHDSVVSGNQGLAEIADPAQTRRQLDLDTMGRRKVDRVVGMEAEPYPFVGDVVGGETPLEQFSCSVDQLRIQPSHDDPPQWSRLLAPYGGSVRFDGQASLGIEPECKALAPEPVH
jgi:hypothetical protein